MIRRVLGFLVLAALLAVPAGAAPIVIGSTVLKLFAVPSGRTAALRIACPPGDLAVSGGVHAAAGVATLRIRPLGLRTYSFRFGNTTSAAAQVTAAVACRRIPDATATAPFLRLTLVRSKPVTVAPGARKGVSLRCPNGTLTGGAGFELDSGRLSVRRRTQTLKAFTLSVRNLGATRGSIDLYGGCLTLIRPPGAPKQRLQVTVQTWTTPIRSGSHMVTHRCPKGWFSLSTGYDLPAGLRVADSSATSSGGRWTLTSAASAQVLAHVQLVCGRIASG
jgi:hypothetical protein